MRHSLQTTKFYWWKYPQNVRIVFTAHDLNRIFSDFVSAFRLVTSPSFFSIFYWSSHTMIVVMQRNTNLWLFFDLSIINTSPLLWNRRFKTVTRKELHLDPNGISSIQFAPLQFVYLHFIRYSMWTWKNAAYGKRGVNCVFGNLNSILFFQIWLRW